MYESVSLSASDAVTETLEVCPTVIPLGLADGPLDMTGALLDETVIFVLADAVPPFPSETVTLMVHVPAEDGAVQVTEALLPVTVPQVAV